MSLSQNRISRLEFVCLMALLMSLAALTIDAILPGLAVLREDLQVAALNDTQLVVTSIFAGMAVGQFLYGPLSDSFGRKPIMYLGMTVFLLGSLLCVFADNFHALIVGRVLQGFGLGAPKTLCLAIIRDKYRGRAMARLMSNITTVFILVPMVAPMLGQLLLLIAGWRWIFIFILLLGVTSQLWMWLRLDETLPLADRHAFSVAELLASTKAVLSNRMAMGYTVVIGFLMGAFMAYLSTAPQVFQQQYQLGQYFVLVFAGLAFCLGAAAHINSVLVMRVAMGRIVWRTLLAMVTTGGLFWVVALFYSGHPPLWLLILYLASTFACLGLLTGNLNALAMELLGDSAGMGATVVSTVSGILAVPLGVVIGHSLQQSIYPLVAGFFLCGCVALVVVRMLQHPVCR